jgi:selenide,water dikinase
MENIKLTSFSHGAGCGCKISPAVLETILKNNQSPLNFKNLLVGNNERDDAAVMDLGDGTALISTTDFFMPIVDDAKDFGKIASANAISDIYAMGGTPLMAIAILGWPVEKINPKIAAAVLEGSREICAKAGIPLAGGHSIDSLEPLFGLAVTGRVKIEHLKKNSTAKAGDLLFLTKPLGVGIFATGLKRGILREEDYPLFVTTMIELNQAGEMLGKIKGVNALTDVTGFGLLGHLIEMCEGSGLSAELDYNKIPLLKGLDFYTNQFCFPDNTTRNLNAYKDRIGGMNGLEFITLCDPQTSGGLLVSLDPSALNEYQEVIRKAGLDASASVPIGKLSEKLESVVYLI